MKSNMAMILPLAELAAFCRHRSIRSLSLFGSLLHGNADSNSDVDLLVEYDPETEGRFVRDDTNGE